MWSFANYPIRDHALAAVRQYGRYCGCRYRAGAADRVASGMAAARFQAWPVAEPDLLAACVCFDQLLSREAA